MKGLTLNILFVILALTVLSMAAANTSWANKLAYDRTSYLSEDPDQPEPESALNSNRVTFLSEDPNEPEPESAYDQAQVIDLSEDPNQPEPESGKLY